MEQHQAAAGKAVYPILFGFFVMGFVDVVGIATNYVKVDFALSDTLANLIPMMVFVWFALFSIPTGILMGKAGRRNTVALAMAITAAAMCMPLFFYDFGCILLAFALLGIGNTMLQVSLNPMVAAVVNAGRITSVLTWGQFIKAVSSFLGPILAGAAASFLGDWKWIFLVYALISLLSMLWLLGTIPGDEKISADKKIPEDKMVPGKDEIPGKEKGTETNTSFFGTIALFKDRYILALFLGILLIVGIDVGLNTTIPKLLMEKTDMPLQEAGLGTSLYFAARTGGAFIGAILLARLPAARFLQYSLWVAVVCFVGLLSAENPAVIFGMIVGVGLACSNVFSILFSFALQHKPERANGISALMIMGVSGGALITPLMGVAADAFGQIAALSILLVCLLYIGFLSYKV